MILRVIFVVISAIFIFTCSAVHHFSSEILVASVVLVACLMWIYSFVFRVDMHFSGYTAKADDESSAHRVAGLTFGLLGLFFYIYQFVF